MGINFRWPEPPQDLEPTLGSYLRQLVRSFSDYDEEVFSQDSRAIFSTARVRPHIEVSTAYAVGVNDSVVLVDASAANVAITLPLAFDVKDTLFDIKKIDATAGTVVSITGSGLEFPTLLTGATRPSVTVFSDGNRFWVI